MTYNPELKKQYDKQRYKKQKEEYFKLNPYYIPIRVKQRLEREALLNKNEVKIDTTTQDKIDSEFLENVFFNCNLTTPTPPPT
jgi:hypothetical protein